MVWGFQGRDNDVVHSHTFASFYKGDDLSKGIIKPATISLMVPPGRTMPNYTEDFVEILKRRLADYGALVRLK